MSEAGLLTGGQSRRHLGRARRHSATGHVRVTCASRVKKMEPYERLEKIGEGKQVLCSGVAT